MVKQQIKVLKKKMQLEEETLKVKCSLLPPIDPEFSLHIYHDVTTLICMRSHKGVSSWKRTSWK